MALFDSPDPDRDAGPDAGLGPRPGERREREERAPITGGSTPPPDDVIVQMRNVHKGFGAKQVLKGVTFELERGTNAVVLGGSGTGKSVTIKHVVGLLKPDKGEVWVKGDRVDLMDEDQLDEKRRSIGYLFQGGALFDSMTVYENMKFYLDRLAKGMPKGEQRDAIFEQLESVNLPQTADQYPAELSGGQKKRIGLARALILKPEIILYDEPTTGLDPVSVRVVSELIVKLRDERGISSISITHDLLAASIITDRAFFLYEGRVIERGTLEEVRRSEHPALQEFFRDMANYVDS